MIEDIKMGHKKGLSSPIFVVNQKEEENSQDLNDRFHLSGEYAKDEFSYADTVHEGQIKSKID